MRRLALVLFVLLLLAPAVLARAQSGPMLHEYLPADTGEDLDMSSTDSSGLPAAVRTPSGTIKPPDLLTTPEPRRVYHRPPENGATFSPDRDTRRPHIEQYDDPFTPSLTPFKRLFAFDAVRDDYTLYVRDEQKRALAVGGSAQDGDERFFGDMAVQLEPAQYVRIPSVGPEARLLGVVTSPNTSLELVRDGADNWFIRSDKGLRLRLVTELAIARDTFGSPFADVPWSSLARVPPQPAAHQAAFQQVAQAIGISRAGSPREVLFKMVAYFRSFSASEESPREHDDIYLALALARKGVCRHRAFAFLVTALNIGIPARLVHNEAHAWVEVHDGTLWHRVDLGGAALDLAEQPDLERPPHRAPPDPYSWPTGRDSGEDLAQRSRTQAQQDQRDPNTTDPNGPPDPNAEPDPNAPPRPDLPESAVTIDTIDHDVFRGLPMSIKGTVKGPDGPCAHVRIDVLLFVQGEPAERRLGTLSTDERGVYDGAVVLPPDLPIGDHELTVKTPGASGRRGSAARCGPGQAR